MNSKMTTNLQLSTTEPKYKNKPSKQLEPEQKWRSHGGLAAGKGSGENGGEGTANKKQKWQVQNRQGEVKNSIENGEAKELICMTYRYELRCRIAAGREDAGWRGIKGRKKQDNWNSIISKIYLKKKTTKARPKRHMG